MGMEPVEIEPDGWVYLIPSLRNLLAEAACPTRAPFLVRGVFSIRFAIQLPQGR